MHHRATLVQKWQRFPASRGPEGRSTGEQIGRYGDDKIILCFWIALSRIRYLATLPRIEDFVLNMVTG